MVERELDSKARFGSAQGAARGAGCGTTRLLGAAARMWRLRTGPIGRIRRPGFASRDASIASTTATDTDPQQLRNDRHHLTPGIESA